MSDEVKEMVILAMDYVEQNGGCVKVNNLHITYVETELLLRYNKIRRCISHSNQSPRRAIPSGQGDSIH